MIGLALGLALASSAPASAGSTLLYDAADGRVLYAEDADQPWYAASLTKMMTAYVLFEDLAGDRLKLTDKIKISAYANAQPKMRLGLGAGKEITIDEAVKALIIESANDIAVAIAEAVEGSEEAFVQRMNATAYRLGMYSTRYINPNGLPGEGQQTTARDLSLLAQALQRDFPQYQSYFALKEAKVGRLKMATHNPVLGLVPGGDGIKTGFTCSAGYNIVGSAARNGQRLVAVVLGAPNKKDRAERVQRLFEFGFARRDWMTAFPAPPVAGLPETPFDRALVREENLGKRFNNCRDPIPELMIASTDLPMLAVAPSVVADAAVRIASASAVPQPGASDTDAEPQVKSRAKGSRLNSRKLRAKLRTKTAGND